MHELFLAPNTPGDIIRLLFVEFKKAFDLIAHNELLDKFCSYNFTDHIAVCHSIFSKCYSLLNLATTILILLQLMLELPRALFLVQLISIFSYGSYMKYVDDKTVYTVSGNADDMLLQLAADDLVQWLHNC
jgi:hypothetical protein